MEKEKTVELLKIDLGCGPNKKTGFKGMDILPLPGVDFVVDLEKGFSFMADNSVDEFYTSHFLEHVQNLELIMAEIHRTLKPGGVLTVFVPHFSNPYYYFFWRIALSYPHFVSQKIKCSEEYSRGWMFCNLIFNLHF